MGRALEIITAPLSLIDRQIGNAISGAVVTAIGLATLNPALISYGVSKLSSSLGAGSPPPETTERGLKSPLPPRVRGYGTRRLYGASLLYTTAGDGTTVDVWAFFDGRANAVLQAHLNDDKVTVSGGTVQTLPDKRYQSGLVKAGWTLGQSPGTAFAAVMAKVPWLWTSAHRGDGVVLGYLLKAPEKSEAFLETYPQGDNVVLSLAMQLAPVFDFRDPAQSPTDPSTWVYKDNAVLAFLHYLMTERNVDYATQIAPQLTYWLAAADECDEAEPLDGGGSEPRYRSCVLYKATDEPAGVINELLKAFDGWYVYNERGEIIVYAGRYNLPTVSIGADEIVSYRHQAFVEDEVSVNEITVTFVSDQHDYNTIDADPWRDEAAIAASGREPNSAPLNAQVPSPTQARRLAKRQMIRTNAANRGTVTTTFAGRTVIGQRYINLDLSESGFSGPVEILSLERNMETGGVTFEWASVDADPDEWDPAIEGGTPPPIVTPPPLTPLDAPTIDDVEPVSESSSDVAVGYRLDIMAMGPDRADLTWFVRLLIDGSYGPAQSFADTAPGAPVALRTNPVPVNTVIGVEIAYQVGDGRLSPWSATFNITIDAEIGNGGPITDATGFLIDEGGVKRVLATDVGDYLEARYDDRYLLQADASVFGATGAATGADVDGYVTLTIGGTSHNLATIS